MLCPLKEMWRLSDRMAVWPTGKEEVPSTRGKWLNHPRKWWQYFGCRVYRSVKAENPKSIQPRWKRFQQSRRTNRFCTHTNSARETSSCLLDLFPFPSPVTPPLPLLLDYFRVCVCVNVIPAERLPFPFQPINMSSYFIGWMGGEGGDSFGFYTRTRHTTTRFGQ